MHTDIQVMVRIGVHLLWAWPLGKALRTASGMFFHTWTIYKQNKLWKALRTASGMLFHTWTIYKQNKLLNNLQTKQTAESFEDTEWHAVPYLNSPRTKQTGESFEDTEWHVVPYLNNLQTKQTAESFEDTEWHAVPYLNTELSTNQPTELHTWAVSRPVYPYGFAVIPMDSDLKFRCYTSWVKNYGHCPIFPFLHFKLQ